MGACEDSRIRSMADQEVESKALTERRANLNRRLRLAFMKGAEEHSRREAGRGLSEEELERGLRRYPGDMLER
jgi:hypothetical protein